MNNCFSGQVIQEHPPRAQTEQRISELEVRLARIQESRQTLEEKLQLRLRQFHVLLTSVHHLQGLMAEEDNETEEGEEEGVEHATMDTS